MRVAIIHDALCVRGGAERVALWMARAFPDAPIYTSVYLREHTFPEYKSLDVRALPFAGFIRDETQFKLLYPLWLLELPGIDFSEFDVVLSSSTYLAKFIRPAPLVRHVAYIYAPFRLLWKPEAYRQGSLPGSGVFERLVRGVVPLLRKWDQARTRAIPRIATTCQHMAKQIMRDYGRSASVIYPPVEIPDVSEPRARGDYFLCVGRLTSHKRVDLAVQACSRLGEPLLVVGDGPEREHLQRLAGPSVEFLGRVSDEALEQLYLSARALIFPSHEDYGLVPLEAQAHGVPVIAFGQGGVLETVKDGVSGMFFSTQDVDSISGCLRSFDARRFPEGQIREWARRFDAQGFMTRLRDFVAAS
jgi:glycosyltransferase involved in cell wall biosynthesis